MLALQERKYYTDEVCRHGFFRGRYTVRYVKDVFERYYFYSEQKQDLEESIEAIEKLISDLEENMKAEFEVKFNEINENNLPLVT